jgi:hypothetical protein
MVKQKILITGTVFPNCTCRVGAALYCAMAGQSAPGGGYEKMNPAIMDSPVYGIKWVFHAAVSELPGMVRRSSFALNESESVR